MSRPFCDTPGRTPGTASPPGLSHHVLMRHPRTLLAGTIAIALTAGGVLGVAPSAQAQPDDARIDLLLHKRLDNPRLGTDVGLVVLDAATGALVSAEQPDELMLPASNQKIITAVAILATLGEQARLTTRVRPGTAPGEIVLQGGGDPLLTTSDLQRLATRTARRIDATVPVVVRVDDDLFPVTGKGPGWTDEYLPYVAAPVEALARLGDYSADPSRNAARVFVQQLRALGLKAKLGEPIDVSDTAPVLAEIHSSVEAAISVMLSRSENNVAEVLFRQVAVAEGVEPTWRGAREATEAVLRRLGLDPTGMRILDGSGLSRRDGLTPRFLADVLRVARVTRPEAFTSMFDPEAMPVAGQTGTLHTSYGRYVTRQSQCARGDVFAKTGSLFDTITLSGVARTTAGGERLFSILVNDRPQQYSALSVRQVLDGLSATITGCWD